MEAMGFTQVKIWYQTQNFNFANADEYCALYCETVTARNLLSKCSPEKVIEFKEDLKAAYNQKLGDGVLDPKSFELTVITAVKP